ncbi:MAG TPA: hypothetical protein VFK47_11590, partial [Ktedonobacteraceae bacterium]|nr:hypothetical protein [Ktedonobacteraceae bacterium]
MADSKGIAGFLEKETGGVPNWVWGLVIVIGIGAAYIVPKFFGGSGTGGTSTTDGSTATGDQTLAGYTPAGAYAGYGGSTPTPTTTTTISPVATGTPQLLYGTGILGPNVKISQKNGAYYYQQPGSSALLPLSNLLPSGATIQGGAQGRYWFT